MRRTICVCLLAWLAVGLAVPVPESTSPSNKEDLINIILSAKSEENDIDSIPEKDQVTVKNEETVTVPVTEAPTEVEIRQAIESVQDVSEGYSSATTENIQEQTVKPKANQTELPKDSKLEPAKEITPIVYDEEQFPKEILVPEITYSENDEVITSPYEETFEEDVQETLVSDDLLTRDDQVFEDEEQVRIDDDLVIPVFEPETPFEEDQMLSAVEMQATAEEEEEAAEEYPEVILVFDESIPIVPNLAEEELPESENDDPQNFEVYPESPEDEETFIIDESEIYSPSEEEEEMIPLELVIPQTEEGQMLPDYEYSEDMATTADDDETNIFPIEISMPEVSMLNKETIAVSISEEPSLPKPNDEEVFVSASPPYFELVPQAEAVQEPDLPVYFDTTDDSDSILVGSDISGFFENDIAQPGIPEYPLFSFSGPAESILEDYYIPDEDISTAEATENEEISENEDDEEPEMNIDVGDIVLNEPIAEQNENDTPALLDILMIKANPSVNGGKPIIEVITSEFPQFSPGFSSEVPFPFSNDQKETDSDMPESVQDDRILINESEILEQNIPIRHPILFPNELDPKYNLPVFPSGIREENFYQPPVIRSKYGTTLESLGESSYQYGYSNIPFSSYGAPQAQSFLRPNPFQQSFMEEQTDDTSEMMNEDINPEMPSNLPISPNVMYDNDDMDENEESDHIHLTDDFVNDFRQSNLHNTFDSFLSSALPSHQGAINQDFRGPNTFPLNFRNPYINRESMNANIFETFRNGGFQGPFQQGHQYDDTAPFPNPESSYNILRGNQPIRYDFRYSSPNQPNPYNSYGSFDFNYPYDNYNSYGTSGLYSSPIIERYVINRPIRNKFRNFRPYNYPTPLW